MQKKCKNCNNFYYFGLRKWCSLKCKSGKVIVPGFSNFKRKGIDGIHLWIVRKLGKPKKCEHCKTTDENKTYDWSNKDHKYSRDPKDWQRLCRSCHCKYDFKYNNKNCFNLAKKLSPV